MLLGFNGCVGEKLSPKVINEMKNNQVTKEQVCKGSGRWTEYKSGPKCDMFYTPKMEDIENGVRFKKFESTCHKMHGIMQFGIPSGFGLSNREKDVHFCTDTDIMKYGFGKTYIFNESEEELYAEVEKIELEKQAQAQAIEEMKNAIEEREKRAAEERKVADAKRIADAKKAKVRMKKLGISEKEVRKTINSGMGGLMAVVYGLKGDRPVTNNQIDSYLKEKARQKKAADFDRKAKIKKGKQYVCTDGYDSWVLKYNGNRITYGDVNMYMNIIGAYVQNQYDKDYVIIDRAKGILLHGGNKLTCKPRRRALGIDF